MMSRTPKRVLEVVMKTCPVCGLDLEDSYLFCPDDGSALVDPPPAGASFTSGLTADTQPHVADAAVPGDEVVVLYCGECAAEFPMTFVECPVHHAALSRHKVLPMPRVFADSPPSVSTDAVEGQQLSSQFDQSGVRAPVGNRSLAAARPAASFRGTAEDLSSQLQKSEAFGSTPSFETPKNFRARPPSRSWSPSILATDESSNDVSREAESRFESPSYRIVAATIVIALVLFCVGAIYIFFSGGGRRQAAARAAQGSSATPSVEQSSFVPTPEDALDYKDEPTVATAATAATKPQEPVPDSARPNEIKKEAPAKSAALAGTAKPPAPVKSTPVSVDRTSKAHAEPAIIRPPALREPALARVAQAGVEARLVRLRSIRTGSGVRYDLTFNLQDESGRHAQWERLQISTRAASGMSHTEAIPFVHRLGASGALTFTISVEMRGHSQADWQGRVVCTTIGSDNDGNPLRASFGTNVIP